jgi:photosystem II stability/assembly factor-like uncharacterized protein
MNILKNKRFNVILLILLIAPLLQAQTEAWQRINPIPVESSLNDISLLPDGRIVAVGSGATVIYSDNDGDDWEIIFVPDSISRDVGFNRVDFADHLHGMAVGSYYSIIKTDDGGETWTNISPGASMHYYDYSDVCCRTPSDCFISGGSSNCFLLHSTDGGTTWDTSFQTTGLHFDQVHFVDSTTGFLGGTGMDFYFKSEDGGQSWEMDTVQPQIEDLHVYTVYFVNKNIGFIGAFIGNWTGGENAILKTVDAGKTWYQVFLHPYAGADVFFFPDQNTGFSISSVPWYSNSLLKTTDGGETWNLVSDHLGRWTFTGICMNDDGNGIIVGSAGQIYRSNDFGNTWEAAFSNEFLKYTIDRAYITGDSSVLANAIVGGGGILYYGVIESGDRGATWNETSSFPDGISAYFSLDDNIEFYGGTPGGIYKSGDGGETWVFHEFSDPEFQPVSIDFIDGQIGFTGGFNEDEGYEFFKTTDQGETWMQIISNALHWVEPSGQLEFFNDSTGYIVGDIGYDTSCNILVSHDLGETWEIDTLPYKYDFNGIHFIDDQTGFLYGWRKVCKTINGGQDWFQVPIDTQGYFNAISMSFPSPQTGYLVNGSGGFYEMIFKTTDGGDTWNSLSSPTTSGINSINFFEDDEGVIVGDNSIIFRTITGGMVDIQDPAPVPGRQSMLTCYPNPFKSQTTIFTTLDLPGNCLVSIYDFSGRKIRQHLCSSARAGETVFTWDGKDDIGNELPTGIYVISLESKAFRETLKIVKF